MDASMIAACGINCETCLVHLRERKPCPGCNGDDKCKPNHCVKCSIKLCEVLVSTKKKLCSECPEMPCRRLKLLDKRYREKYGMSEIENLENIRKWGMAKFIRQEKMRWTCPQCGAVICVHRDHCLKCNAPRVRKRTDQEKA